MDGLSSQPATTRPPATCVVANRMIHGSDLHMRASTCIAFISSRVYWSIVYTCIFSENDTYIVLTPYANANRSTLRIWSDLGRFLGFSEGAPQVVFLLLLQSQSGRGSH